MEIIFFVFLVLLLPGTFGDSFLDECKIRLVGILNGTESYGPINNETIDEFDIIHNGSVGGINPNFALDDLLRVTRKW